LPPKVIFKNAKKDHSLDFYLYYKDVYGISDEDFNNLRNRMDLAVPPINQVKKRRIAMNKEITIHEAGGGFYKSSFN
jgi:hypothetical protein